MNRAVFPIVAIALVLVQAPAHAADTSQTLAIHAGRILTVANGVVENGVIIIRDGKIEGVGVGLDVPEGVQTVDASDKVVVPGFIDAH